MSPRQSPTVWCPSSLSSIDELRPRVIIISSGPHPIHFDGVPSFPYGFLRYAEENNVYVLVIYYGLYLMLLKLGGEVTVGRRKIMGKKQDSLVQKTLYLDVIDSCPPPRSGRTHSYVIKSHHNVGGLPKDMKPKLAEPL